MKCRICTRFIAPMTNPADVEAGIGYRDTKGGAHCQSRDNEYHKVEDSPLHDVAPVEHRQIAEVRRRLAALEHLQIEHQQVAEARRRLAALEQYDC